MANTLLNKDQASTVLPKWEHPIIPGHAVQGSLLFTLSDFVDPPQQSNLFMWIPMEDIIGTQDVRLDFNEEENKFTIMKAKGHMDNNGTWHQDWFEVGSFNAISKEVQEALENMKYVEYKFDTSVANTLRVIGVLKDGVEELLCLISFVSKQEFDNAVTNIYNRINQEVTRATNRENEIETALGNEVTRATNRENQIEASVVAERSRATIREDEIDAALVVEINRATAREDELEDMIEDTTPKAGAATEVVDDATGGKAVNVLVDGDNIKINNSNQLTTDVFDDTQVRSDKGWSSSRISQELVGAMHYMGQVPTYADLPTTGMRAGDLYNVEDTGDNYAWDATLNRWDKQSGDYIPGPGIDITGKRISATGVSFGTGDGLEVIGSGADATLRVKGGNGLQFATDKTVSVKPGENVTVDNNGVNVNISDGLQSSTNGIKVKPANGINVSAEGVSVKVGKATTINTDGQVEIKPESTSPLVVNPNGLNIQAEDGIYIDNNRLKINANFTRKSTPLGTDNSKLAIYSDGKIAVDFEEDPVILEGELLAELAFSANQNIYDNISVPDLKEYQMIFAEVLVGTNALSICHGYFPLPSSDGTSTSITNITANRIQANHVPQGMVTLLLQLENIDVTNNVIGTISTWRANSWLSDTTNWTAYQTTNPTTVPVLVRIYGMKAK